MVVLDLLLTNKITSYCDSNICELCDFFLSTLYDEVFNKALVVIYLAGSTPKLGL